MLTFDVDKLGKGSEDDEKKLLELLGQEDANDKREADAKKADDKAVKDAKDAKDAAQRDAAKPPEVPAAPKP